MQRITIATFIAAALTAGIANAEEAPKDGAFDAHSPAEVSPEQAWKIGWPCLTGPYHTWAAVPSGLKLVDDVSKVRHMWASEEAIPSTKEQNAGWVGKVMQTTDRAPLSGGANSPILVDGRAYLNYYVPSGTAMDEVERYGGMRFSGGSPEWSYQKRLHFERTGATGVGLIEADDMVLCVDAMTGRTLWKRRFAGKGSNYQTRKDPGVNQRTMCFANGPSSPGGSVAAGPSSPKGSAAAGMVYALGSNCRLCALDAASGELLWETATADHQRYRQHKLVALAKRRRGGWGGTLNPSHGFGFESLLALGGRIIVKASGGLQAFDAATGRLVWTQPEAGISGEGVPLPAVWQHEGKTYLLGCCSRGTVTCTEAETGKVMWRQGGLFDELNRVIARGNVMVGAAKATAGDEKDKAAVYAGYTLTPEGFKPRWRLDPTAVGLWYHNNPPSFGHDGLLYVGQYPLVRRNGRVMKADDNLDTWLALDPATGEIRKTFLTDKAYRCHHVALMTMDDGWVWGKFNYRSFLYMRADGRKHAATSLPQIEGEGGKFISAYGTPVALPYAAGRMIIRGQKRLHGLDFRADPGKPEDVERVPAWAGDLPEPVRSMASRHHTDREEALKRFAKMDKAGQSRLLPQLVRLVQADDAVAQLAGARALAAAELEMDQVAPELRAVLIEGIGVGRGDLAASLGACLARDSKTVSMVAACLSPDKLQSSVAACRALGNAGPAGAGALDAVLPLLETKDDVLLRAALDTLVRLDRPAETVPPIAALLAHTDTDVALLAADALAEIGPAAAPAALPAIARILKPLEPDFVEYGSTGRGSDPRRILAGRLVFVCGRLGGEAAPLLQRLAVATIRDDDKPSKSRPEILGALAALGPDAVSVAQVWWGGNEQQKSLALELTEVMVRRNTPPDVLMPFCGPLLDGGSLELKVRAAEWLLRVDASQANPFQVLEDLCESDATPAAARAAAAKALSGQIILPYNAMTDAMRRRGVQALVGVIRRGEAPPIVITQCAGMAPFIDKEDLTFVQDILQQEEAEE